MLKSLAEHLLGSPKPAACPLGALALDQVVHFGVPAGAAVLAYDAIQQLLAVGSVYGQVKMFGRAGVEQLLAYGLDEPRPGAVRLLEFSSNAHILLSAHDGGLIVVWDLFARRASARLSANDVVTAMHAPIGSSFAYAGTAVGTVLVLDLSSGDGRRARFSSYTLCHEQAAPHALKPAAVVAVATSPLQDELLLAAWADGTIALIDLLRRAPLCTFARLPAPAPSPTCLSWHPSGRRFVAGFSDGTLAVWAADAPGRPQLSLAAAPEAGGARRPIRSAHWGDAPASAPAVAAGGVAAAVPALFLLGGTLLEAEPDALLLLRGERWSERLIFPGNVAACGVRSFALAGGAPLRHGGVHRPVSLLVLSAEGRLLLYSLAQSGVAPLHWPSAIPRPPLTAICRLGGGWERRGLREGINPFGPWPMRGGELRAVHAEQMLLTAHADGSIALRDASTRGLLPLRAVEEASGGGGRLRVREPCGCAVPLLQPFGGGLVVAGRADGGVELLWLEERARFRGEAPAAEPLPPLPPPPPPPADLSKREDEQQQEQELADAAAGEGEEEADAPPVQAHAAADPARADAAVVAEVLAAVVAAVADGAHTAPPAIAPAGAADGVPAGAAAAAPACALAGAQLAVRSCEAPPAAAAQPPPAAPAAARSEEPRSLVAATPPALAGCHTSCISAVLVTHAAPDGAGGYAPAAACAPDGAGCVCVCVGGACGSLSVSLLAKRLHAPPDLLAHAVARLPELGLGGRVVCLALLDAASALELEGAQPAHGRPAEREGAGPRGLLFAGMADGRVGCLGLGDVMRGRLPLLCTFVPKLRSPLVHLALVRTAAATPAGCRADSGAGSGAAAGQRRSSGSVVDPPASEGAWVGLVHVCTQGVTILHPLSHAQLGQAPLPDPPLSACVARMQGARVLLALTQRAHGAHELLALGLPDLRPLLSAPLQLTPSLSPHAQRAAEAAGAPLALFWSEAGGALTVATGGQEVLVVTLAPEAAERSGPARTWSAALSAGCDIGLPTRGLPMPERPPPPRPTLPTLGAQSVKGLLGWLSSAAQQASAALADGSAPVQAPSARAGSVSLTELFRTDGRAAQPTPAAGRAAAPRGREEAREASARTKLFGSAAAASARRLAVRGSTAGGGGAGRSGAEGEQRALTGRSASAASSMRHNVEALHQRGDKLSDLAERVERLNSESENFHDAACKLREANERKASGLFSGLF